MRSGSLLSRTGGLFIAGAALIAGTAAACSGSDDGADVVGGCPDDLAFFEANIWEPILAKKCAVCHSEGGLAKGTRMVLRPGSEPGALEANFEAVKAIAGSLEDGGESALLLRPSGRHSKGHTGGTLIPFQGADYKTFETFVARVNQGKQCDAPIASCAKVSPGARMLRRLSRREYDATIQDLFGFESKWGASFTADTVVNGFDNNASALKVTPLLADQARRAAEEIAELAMQSPGALVPCDPAAGDAACADKFIDSFGKRAFRRPLDDADRKRYADLYTLVAGEDGFTEALKTVISALLQSPYFLYRLELGGLPEADGMVNLTQHEIASELSYFFWGSMPDQELFAAADAGSLSTPEAIEKQARRLLADPRSDTMLERFTEQWLEIDRLASVPKDATVFPELDAALRSAMGEETKRFISHVVREGTGTLPELFTAKYTFASPELAAFYGLPAPAGVPGEPSMIDLAGTPRAGLLTQGSLLTTHARPNASSPIHRGKLVRERLLCQSLPPPPPGLNVQPPPVDPSKTTRERYAAHATVEPCLSCHRLVDPIGFGFEHFDGIGRYRDAEGPNAIDATGEIVATESTNGAFDGTGELASVLAESPDVHACFALQWFRFAYGVEEDASLSCAVDEVGSELEASGLSIEELLVALTRSPHFTRRMSDGSEAGASGGTSGGTSGGMGGAGGVGGGGDPGAGGAPPVGGLDIVRTNDTKWETGYCDSVKVTNTSGAAVVWSIKLAIDGSLTDIWNAQSAGTSGTITVTGVEWNASLEPQASASFGFCASL